jgi:hypothetical protein
MRFVAACVALSATSALAQLPPLKAPLAAPQFQTPQLKPQAAPQIQAPPLTPHITGYAAETANTGFQGSATAGGAVWHCAGGKCTASGSAATPTVQACSELARTAGALRSFAYGQSTLGPDELGQCNATVASAPKQGIGSMPHMGGLAPLPMMAAPMQPGAPKESESDKPPGANVPGERPVSGATLPAFKPALPAAPMMSMPDLKPGPAIQQAIKPAITLQAAPAAVAPDAVRAPPFNITTGALSMTGNRFTPVTITTSALSMTGNRFEAVTITTSPLSMTGNRFETVNITTGTLSMTGTR